MNSINLYSKNKGEIQKFLESYDSKNYNLTNNLKYKKEFQNPLDMIDIISCYIDNKDKFKIRMWISIDDNIYIKINEYNINRIIKYLYERYPW